MLKKQVAELVKPYIESSGFSGQDSLARVKVLSHQILTFFKAEVDKLTVIEDDEIMGIIAMCGGRNRPDIADYDKELSQAQLQHTKKQLLKQIESDIEL